jgi:hypothetical protein
MSRSEIKAVLIDISTGALIRARRRHDSAVDQCQAQHEETLNVIAGALANVQGAARCLEIAAEIHDDTGLPAMDKSTDFVSMGPGGCFRER